MNDPLVLILFLATWGGIVLLFRRLADDFRKATVRQSENQAQPQIDEELLRITGEVQETIEGLSEAMGKRAEQLRELLAEADIKIESLHAALRTAPAGDAELPRPLADLSPSGPQRATASPEPPAAAADSTGGSGGRASAASEDPENSARGSRGSGASPASRAPWLAEPQPVAAGRASAAEVLRLAAEGHPIETIARLTNRGREEVSLLLGTHKPATR